MNKNQVVKKMHMFNNKKEEHQRNEQFSSNMLKCWHLYAFISNDYRIEGKMRRKNMEWKTIKHLQVAKTEQTKKH